MRYFKALAFVGTGAFAANTKSAKPCYSLSTVFVTVTGSPNTETVYASNVVKNDTTIFNTLPATQIFTVIQGSALPASELDNGVTNDASIALVTSSMTRTITRTKALVVRAPSFSVLGTAKAYAGLAGTGWNATTLSVTKIASTGASAMPVTASKQQLKPTDNSFSASTFRLKARDVGEMVVATMDGKVVSWLNEYESYTPKTSSAKASSTPSVVVPIYQWDVTPPLSSSVPTSSIIPRPSENTMFPTPSAFATATRLPSPPRGPNPALMSSTTSQGSFSTVEDSISCKDSPAMFTIDFDDLPHFSISNEPQNQNIPPIFNPYRKLYFEDNFGYVPPPSAPYLPHSPPQFAVYRASGTTVDGSRSAGLQAKGEIGAGPYESDSAYWVDAYSAYFGCSDGTSSACLLTIHGYIKGQKGPSVMQRFELPSCPGLKNCSLTLVKLESRFRGLSGFQITAAIGRKPVDYYMDDLKLGWSNNTCAAQLKRSSAE